jgi:alpha,alpha-trehalose-phosphate synthase [UDP-forming]
MSESERAPKRMVIVSNRGPYKLRQTKQGLRRERSVGGLVTSVLPMVQRFGGVWVAWGDPEGRFVVPPRHSQFVLRNLSLTPEQVEGYYHGLSNGALWPMCHYFLGRVRYEEEQWQSYEEVNRCFAEATVEEAAEGDVVWFHDYQLARAPYFVRQARPSLPLILFWHIPFPAVEVFRTLPWRSQLLEGMLACDLVGFHIPEYAKNFIEAAVDILGATAEGDTVHYGGRATSVIARPIGIDFASVDHDARAARTEHLMMNLRRSYGDQALVLGVERMDYTKGIIERMRGVEHLLEHHPEWMRKFSLIQIVTPSRTEVAAYRKIKREVDEAVGRINGRFSDGAWQPIRYLYRSVSFSELIAFYRTADVALVTPLRDGLNLVAKEYVAARIHSTGALILSEFAGVAQQLPEAILTNPYSPEEMAAALDATLRMPEDEQQRRMEPMRQTVAAQDINWWSREFLARIGLKV